MSKFSATSGLRLLSIAALSFSSMASQTLTAQARPLDNGPCNPPLPKSTPAISVPSVTKAPEAAIATIAIVQTPITGVERLDLLTRRVDVFIKTCESDLEKQQHIVEQLATEIAHNQDKTTRQIDQMTFVRNLLDGPQQVLCINGLTVTKEQLAAVLSLKLTAFSVHEHEHSDLLRRMELAKAELVKIEARVAKWQKQQADLISRVDRIRAENNARLEVAQAASDAKLALEQALALADQLDAQFNALSETSVETISEAAQKFDDMFGKPVSRR